MVAICCGAGAIGLFIGFVFTLLYISFNNNWIKMLSSVFTIGGSGFSIWALYDKFNITNTNEIFYSITFLIIAFLITFSIIMTIACYLKKDDKDKNIIRVRDILLGQKQYIQTYYRAKEKEIEEKLGMPALLKKRTRTQ